MKWASFEIGNDARQVEDGTRDASCGMDIHPASTMPFQKSHCTRQCIVPAIIWEGNLQGYFASLCNKASDQ